MLHSKKSFCQQSKKILLILLSLILSISSGCAVIQNIEQARKQLRKQILLSKQSKISNKELTQSMPLAKTQSPEFEEFDIQDIVREIKQALNLPEDMAVLYSEIKESELVIDERGNFYIDNFSEVIKRGYVVSESYAKTEIPTIQYFYRLGEKEIGRDTEKVEFVFLDKEMQKKLFKKKEFLEKLKKYALMGKGKRLLLAFATGAGSGAAFASAIGVTATGYLVIVSPPLYAAGVSLAVTSGVLVASIVVEDYLEMKIASEEKKIQSLEGGVKRIKSSKVDFEKDYTEKTYVSNSFFRRDAEFSQSKNYHTLTPWWAFSERAKYLRMSSKRFVAYQSLPKSRVSYSMNLLRD